MNDDWGSVGTVMAVACAVALSLSCGSSDDPADESDPSGGAAPSGEGTDGAGAPDGTGAPSDPASPAGVESPSGSGAPSADGAGSSNEGAPSGVTGVGASGTGDVGDGAGTNDGAGPSEPGPTRPPYDFGATVEDTGADCAVPELADAAQLPRIDRLPDPFTQLDGTRVTQASQWRCRRQELLRQAEKYIYGEKPTKPELVTGSVTSDTLTVQVQHEGKSIQFSAEVVLPPGNGPFPALINLGARSGFGGITLGEQFILDQGVAIIYYNHGQLGTEGMPEASRGLPNPGLFYDLYGGTHSAGLLMAWAWGASRMLDVLQESGSGIIDPNRVGVTGCSRNGKGAFTVGVFDERIALTIPQETSTGGLPSYRMVDVLPGAERTNYNYFGLNWLSNVFEPFVENATQLPVDSHEMVAMVAPRGLLVLDNPHIAQFAATAAHTAVLAGSEVYRALGVLDNVSYVSDVASDVHCASGKPEYTQAITQSIAKFLKHEPGSPAIVRAGATGTGDLSQWRDWQTPTFEAAPTQ